MGRRAPQPLPGRERRLRAAAGAGQLFIGCPGRSVLCRTTKCSRSRLRRPTHVSNSSIGRRHPWAGWRPAPPRTGHRAACRRSRLRRCGIRRVSPRSAGHGGGRGPRPDRHMARKVCGNELPSPGGRPRCQHKAAACEAAARLTGARLCISRIRSRHPARHCLWQLECRRPAFRGAADRSGAKDR